MKLIAGIMISLCAAVFLFFNCSKDNPTGNSGVIPDLTRVLILSSNASSNQWITDTFPVHMTGFTFSAWDFDDSVPPLERLSEYDVVLLFRNGSFTSDSTGDRMYEYVMQGGNLVLCTFYWLGRTDGGMGSVGWGQLESIDPVFADYGDAYDYDSTGTWIEHPLTRGLDTIYSHFGGGYDSLRSNATAVAWWNNGQVLMAYNTPAGRIVAVTLFPAEPGSYTTGKYNGFYRAFENALLYAAWGDTRN